MNMYSIKDVAKMLSVSTKTVYRLINQGKLAMVKIGRSTRIDEVELDNFLLSLRREWR